MRGRIQDFQCAIEKIFRYFFASTTEYDKLMYGEKSAHNLEVVCLFCLSVCLSVTPLRNDVGLPVCYFRLISILFWHRTRAEATVLFVWNKTGNTVG